MSLPADRFPEFFRALHGEDRDPFPWQTMLVEHLLAGEWPQAIDLPTASGKTAVMDAALYALAAESELPNDERRAPRRIWFVVDRRIVVDEAYERGRRIARRLGAAKSGILFEVARRLKELSGTARPVVAARLRGGLIRDDGWARWPAQPAILTSTVDQLGSRLLFRGYGAGARLASIHSGLAAVDSLVILDEAHCSVPFLETLQAISRYQAPGWAEHPIRLPFRHLVMSATPPEDVASVFPSAGERARALDHPLLRQRIEKAKPATLELTPGMRPESLGTASDPLVRKATDLALDAVASGCRKVAIMVNRVATAQAIRTALGRARSKHAYKSALLTGRMRPFDRDRVLGQWRDLLATGSEIEVDEPLVLVTTQCLEVGADFSFDALVTECASLDALQQRFGRLDRLGREPRTKAYVVTRRSDVGSKSDDPVYGRALAETWAWLNEHATADGKRRIFDLGIAATAHLIGDLDREHRASLAAPAPHAPRLLPAHLDVLVQTAPMPDPGPEPAVFLHGAGRGSPEVRVLWRRDVGPRADVQAAMDALSLAPPRPAEIVSLPLRLVRAYLEGRLTVADTSDIEGESAQDAEPGGEASLAPAPRLVIVWRGRDESQGFEPPDVELWRGPTRLRPNDVLVLPAHESDPLFERLGLGEGDHDLDVLERVAAREDEAPALRIGEVGLGPFRESSGAAALLEWARTAADEDDQTSVETGLADLLHELVSQGSHADPETSWLHDLASRLLPGVGAGARIDPHPLGGFVVSARISRTGDDTPSESDPFADDDDSLSYLGREVGLSEHLGDVREEAARVARYCLPPSAPLRSVERSGWLHDLGKADVRFQTVLHGGSEMAAVMAAEPLAKSRDVVLSRAARRRIVERAGLPSGWRHEFLSLELAQKLPSPIGDAEDVDLVLHLVASHHGHARPHAPVVADPHPPDVGVALEAAAERLEISLDAEKRRTSAPAHHLSSGVAERFWRLTRRYGWWGLAYLECLLRLADWRASQLEQLAEPAPFDAQETSR